MSKGAATSLLEQFGDVGDDHGRFRYNFKQLKSRLTDRLISSFAVRSSSPLSFLDLEDLIHFVGILGFYSGNDRPSRATSRNNAIETKA